MEGKKYYGKKPRKKMNYRPWEDKEREQGFNVDKWIKKNLSNVEYPKRGKKNTLDDGRRKRKK